MGFKTKVSHFKVKNVPLKDTNGKGVFKKMFSQFFFFSGQRKASRHKIVLRGSNLRFFFTAELFACFETQPSSEVFKHFRFADNEFYLKVYFFLIT